MRWLSQLCLLLVCALWMASKSECVVTLRTPPAAPLGSTVTLYCDIIGESGMPGGIFWGRANYDGTFSVTYIGTSLPSNYATGYTTPNNTYYLATLTITGVTSVDYATFSCMSRSSKNLTQGKLKQKLLSEHDQRKE